MSSQVQIREEDLICSLPSYLVSTVLNLIAVMFDV